MVAAEDSTGEGTLSAESLTLKQALLLSNLLSKPSRRTGVGAAIESLQGLFQQGNLQPCQNLGVRTSFVLTVLLESERKNPLTAHIHHLVLRDFELGIEVLLLIQVIGQGGVRNCTDEVRHSPIQSLSVAIPIDATTLLPP